MEGSGTKSHGPWKRSVSQGGPSDELLGGPRQLPGGNQKHPRETRATQETPQEAPRVIEKINREGSEGTQRAPRGTREAPKRANFA